MTPATMCAFVKAFNNQCNIMGWNQGTQAITSYANATGVIVDIVKAYYGQINETTLKTCCDNFCKAGGANFKIVLPKTPHDGSVSHKFPRPSCSGPP